MSKSIFNLRDCSSPWLQGVRGKWDTSSSAGGARGAFCFPCDRLRSPAAVVSPGAVVSPSAAECLHVYPLDWLSRLRTPAWFLSGIAGMIYHPLSHSVLSLLLPAGVIRGLS